MSDPVPINDITWSLGFATTMATTGFRGLKTSNMASKKSNLGKKRKLFSKSYENTEGFSLQSIIELGGDEVGALKKKVTSEF